MPEKPSEQPIEPPEPKPQHDTEPGNPNKPEPEPGRQDDGQQYGSGGLTVTPG